MCSWWFLGAGAPELVLHSYRESHLHFGLRRNRVEAAIRATKDGLI